MSRPDLSFQDLAAEKKLCLGAEMVLAFSKPVSPAPGAHALHSFIIMPLSEAPTFHIPHTWG